MMETYFAQASVLDRLRSGPIGPYLPGFVTALEQRCYSRDTIRRCLRGADALSRWLDGQTVALAEANQSHVRAYVAQHARLPDARYVHGRLSKAASSVPLIAALLREQGILSGSVLVSRDEAWLVRFDNHLTQVHGLASYSRNNYVRYARRLAQTLSMNGADWTALDAHYISDFVRREAARLKPGSRRQVVTATRAILRFLVAEGVVSPNLHRAIPVIREWQHASLPQYISNRELERVLEICRNPSQHWLRDTCIVLMMARLGMRAGEVRQLKLDDLDWITGVVHIRLGKSRRERILPLFEDIGQALGNYLRQERPKSRNRSIFLTKLPPYRPLACSTTITKITKRILNQAGIVGPHLGAHRLRHTLATHLVRSGSSFKEIADVLGHKSLRSTGIYAKLDETCLGEVALPWPGGAR
jgi:site-specific recombinase XerD